MIKNTADVHYENLKQIFLTILKHGPLSKKEIQNRTALSWGCISMQTNELIELGLVDSVSAETNRLGRTPQNLEINTSRHLVLGIDINLSGLLFMVTSMRGTAVFTKKIDTFIPSKDAVLALLFDNVSAILHTYPHIFAIGVSMQGQLDTSKGISLYSPYFEDWKNIPLKDLLEEKTQLPVFVFHDPDCLMKKELYSGAMLSPSISNALILRLDEGIGMSALLNGQIFNGTSGLANEIGHTVVHPNGAPCVCGKRGCLEAYCSKKGILSRFVESSITNHYDKYTYATVVKKANEGNRLALHIFELMGYYLGITLSNLISLFEPQVILLTGSLVNEKHLFEESMREQIDSAGHFERCPAKLVYSPFEPFNPCVGAVLFTVESMLPSLLKTIPNGNTGASVYD